jgi:hypothetical protein
LHKPELSIRNKFGLLVDSWLPMDGWMDGWMDEIKLFIFSFHPIIPNLGIHTYTHTHTTNLGGPTRKLWTACLIYDDRVLSIQPQITATPNEGRLRKGTKGQESLWIISSSFCNYPLQPAVIIYFLVYSCVYSICMLHLLVYIFSLSLSPSTLLGGEQHNDH